MRVKPIKPGPLWKFFSSIWLAVGLMLVIGVVCIIGHGLGIKETEQVFFESWWFSGILVVLGLNIAVCTMNRSLANPPGWFPWQLSQIPWLMVHLGLLTIILAGMLTRLRTEGQVFVREGTTERTMFMQEREVVIERPAKNEKQARDVRLTHLPQTKDDESLLQRRDQIAWIGALVWIGFMLLGAGAAWKIANAEAALLVGAVTLGLGIVFHVGSQKAAGFEWDLGDGAKLQFERYYPHFDRQDVIEDDPDGQGPPALELEFTTQRPKREKQVWVPLEPGYSNIVDMHGMAPVCAQRFYTREDLERGLSAQASLGSVVLRSAGREVAVSLDALVPPAGSVAGDPALGTPLDATVEVAGSKVHLSRFFWKLIVERSGAQQLARDAAPGSLENPAVQIDKIEHPDGKVEMFDRFYAFGNPAFRGLTIHAAPASVDVSYRFGVWQIPDPNTETLSLVVGPTSQEVRLLRTGPSAPAPTTFDAIMALPRLDGPITHGELAIRLVRHASAVRQVKKLVPVDPKVTADGEKLPDAVFVRLTDGEKSGGDWVPFGLDGSNRVQVQVGDEQWFVSYRSKTHDLPYEIHLNDFKIEWAPGLENQRPLAFESEVTVKNAPDASIPSFDYRIYMNHTLVHEGFTFYQSSYIRAPGQPDISIFQVQSDPGQYVFYIGSLIMSLGVLMIFYVKPWLRQVELRQRGQAPAAAAAPVANEPTKSEPAKSEPTQSEPTKSEPTKPAEPAEPVAAEPPPATPTPPTPETPPATPVATSTTPEVTDAPGASGAMPVS